MNVNTCKLQLTFCTLSSHSLTTVKSIVLDYRAKTSRIVLLPKFLWTTLYMDHSRIEGWNKQTNKVEKIGKIGKGRGHTLGLPMVLANGWCASSLCHVTFFIFLCQAKWFSVTGLRICCWTQLLCIVAIIFNLLTMKQIVLTITGDIYQQKFTKKSRFKIYILAVIFDMEAGHQEGGTRENGYFR